MKRRILSLALALCLCLTMLVTVAASESPYSDIGSHPARSAILKWSDYGIIQGNGGKFRPDDTVTRGEMAVILDRLLRFKDASANTFTDLDDNFYTQAMLKANAAKIILGDSKKIRPKGKITNEETVVMLARALGIPAGNPAKVTFADIKDISDWALGAGAAFHTRGYLDITDNKFLPKHFTTRGELVAMLDRIVGAVYNYRGVYTEKVTGIAVVNADGVTLRNCNISGEIIVSPSVEFKTVELSTSSFAAIRGAKFKSAPAIEVSLAPYPSFTASGIQSGTFKNILYKTDADGLITVMDTFSNGAVVDLRKYIFGCSTGDTLSAVSYDLKNYTLAELAKPLVITTHEGKLGNININIADNATNHRLNTVCVSGYEQTGVAVIGDWFGLLTKNTPSSYLTVDAYDTHGLEFAIAAGQDPVSYTNKSMKLAYLQRIVETKEGIELTVWSSESSLSPDYVSVRPRLDTLSADLSVKDGLLFADAAGLEKSSTYQFYLNTPQFIERAKQAYTSGGGASSATRMFTATTNTASVPITELLLNFNDGDKLQMAMILTPYRTQISSPTSAYTVSKTSGNLNVKAAVLTIPQENISTGKNYAYEITLPDGIQTNALYVLGEEGSSVTYTSYAIDRPNNKLIFTVPANMNKAAASYTLHSISGLTLKDGILSFAQKSSQTFTVS